MTVLWWCFSGDNRFLLSWQRIYTGVKWPFIPLKGGARVDKIVSVSGRHVPLKKRSRGRQESEWIHIVVVSHAGHRQPESWHPIRDYEREIESDIRNHTDTQESVWHWQTQSRSCTENHSDSTSVYPDNELKDLRYCDRCSGVVATVHVQSCLSGGGTQTSTQGCSQATTEILKFSIPLLVLFSENLKFAIPLLVLVNIFFFEK